MVSLHPSLRTCVMPRAPKIKFESVQIAPPNLKSKVRASNGDREIFDNPVDDPDKICVKLTVDTSR
jgi:hypothetical protein